MFFQKRLPLQKLYEQKKLIIESSIPEFPFSPNEQIGENSIDLRLHPQVKRLKDEVEEISLLNVSLDSSHFAEDVITDDGYLLPPKQILFCQTIEMINIISTHHIGIVVGRTKIAAYGVSVNINQVKVPAGLLWNFHLHIQNNTDKHIRIYPFICVAQLMIFPYAYGNSYKKGGDYHNIDFLKHLGINQKESDAVRETLEKWVPLQLNYQFQENRKKTVNEIEKKKKAFSKLRRTVFNSDFFYKWLMAIIYLAVPGSVLFKEFNLPLYSVIGLGCLVSALYAFKRLK